MRYLILLLLPFYVNVYAGDIWTDEQKKLELGYVSLILIDWHQTYNIQADPVRYHESNFLIGSRPTNEKINRYMIGTIITHYMISDYLSSEYRTKFQYFTLGIEASVIYLNWESDL